MVVKKANKNVKLNNKNQEKKKVIEKKPEIESDDCESFDDMSDEEIAKMLGDSDNSDIGSDEFSEEEQVELKEAKVGKKRKLDTDDEEEDIKDVKKSKICENNETDEEEDDEDDEDDDDDEEMENDSFIDDEDELEEEEEEEEKVVVVEKPTKKVEIKQEKATKKVETKQEKSIKVENTEQKIKEKQIKIDRTQENEEFKKIYEETPKVESESLRKELQDRIIERKKKTLVLLGLPFKFNQTQAKELIPDMVSIILPYNVHRHQINGNAYIDISKPELLSNYISKLNGFKIKSHKLTCLPLNKVDDNIDNYNCTRLVISNLSSHTTVDSLKRTMVKATTVKMLPIRKHDKRMTLTAFAEYPSVEEAIFDYDTKHGVEIDGMLINVKFQSRSNTNIKKGISWNKTALDVIGINKAMRLEDMKKLFPQASNINWKVGDQVANVNYENVDDCAVDYTNSFKIKPHANMKIFYKCLMHKTGKNDKKHFTKKSNGDNENVKENNKEKKVFNNKKEFKPKKNENVVEKTEGKNEKKNFKSKQKFNGKGKRESFGPKKDFNGVKKTNFKPSHNKNSKNMSERESIFNTKLSTTGNVKTVEKNIGSLKSNNENFKKIASSGEKNSEKTEKKNMKGKENVVNIPTKNKNVNVETLKSDKRQIKKEQKIKSNLINKKKQEKRAKKILKKRLRKEKFAKEQNKL